jgi:virulence factor
VLQFLAEKNKCITQVSFQRRFTPVIVKLREKCLEHGPITFAVCRFYKCARQPFLGSRDHMMDDTVHSIDTLRWICGGEIEKIDSHTGRIGTPDINFISAALHFDNGADGYLINNWSTGKRIFSVDMHAPNVHAEVEHEVGGYLYENGYTEGIWYDAKGTGNGGSNPYAGVLQAIEDFVDGCKMGRQAQSNFSETLKTMETAQKILSQSLLKEH